MAREVQRFRRYADVFEQVFESDDWSLLEPYFTEDAVYEVHAAPPFGGRHEGRAGVFSFLKESLDTFDRRFDSRELDLLEGPELRDGKVWMRWRVTFRTAGAPPLVMEGEETAAFDGDRIQRLEDHFTPETQRRTDDWFASHAEALKRGG